MNKEKIKKIYEYLTELSIAHTSYENKKHGWSMYTGSKHRGCSVRKHSYDKNYNFDLTEIDFKRTSFWDWENDITTIFIEISISKDLEKLSIENLRIENGSSLKDFFTMLDTLLSSSYIYKREEITKILEVIGR